MKSKNTQIIRIISALLVGILLLCSVGCSTEQDSGKDADTTQEQKEEIPWQDSLPKDMDYHGAVIRGLNADGYNPADEMPQEVVSRATYDANVNVSERMNVSFQEFEHTGYGYDEVRTMINGGLDECDVIFGTGVYFVPFSLEGLVIDMAKTEEISLLDLDAPWWAKEFNDSLNVGDFIYALKGQFDSSMEYGPCVIFVNNVLYELIEGEGAKIYPDVKEGTWTIDRMMELTRKAYKDDGDGVESEGDRFGAQLGTGGVGIQALAYGAGAYFTKRDENNMPYSDVSNERNILINEKLYDLINVEGTVPKDMLIDFAGGNLLFFEECADLCNRFRDFKDDWTMVPLPKMNEDQEKYVSTLHWSTFVMEIPVTTSPDKYEVVFTFAELASAEHNRIVRPAILDEAMKNKYSRDEETKEMVDLIAASASTDFFVFYGANSGMNDFFDQNSYGTRDISSMLSRKDKGIDKSIQKMLEELEKNSSKN